jgi:hypothetical protein
MVVVLIMVMAVVLMAMKKIDWNTSVVDDATGESAIAESGGEWWR